MSTLYLSKSQKCHQCLFRNTRFSSLKHTLFELDITTVKQAYFIFKGMDESKRHGIWESISKSINTPRDRIYKFFRFTWSKQFYKQLDEVRPKLKADILNELKNTTTRDGAHQKVWKVIWAKWKDTGLHYEATDQFCRNTVNFWFKENREQPKSEIKILHAKKSHEMEFPNPQNISIVEPQSESIESDSFEDDMVIGIRRKNINKRVRQTYYEDQRIYDFGDLNDWPNDQFFGFGDGFNQ